MYLPIDADSGLPIYRQIADALRLRIVSGGLAPGSRLPSIRELCASLRVNPATVNRAYRELEVAGWVVTRRGLGYFVADPLPAPRSAAALDVLAQPLDILIERARLLGLSEDELLHLVRLKCRAALSASPEPEPEDRR